LTIAPNETEVEFDPFLAGTDTDPYPRYARLREEAPVYRSPRNRFFAISRLDDVQSVSCDWRRFSNANGIDLDQSGEHFGPNFVSSDPPRHRLLRRLLQPRFSPSAVAELLGPVVSVRASELVDRLRLAGPPTRLRSHQLGGYIGLPATFAL
jgi:cytochrome P450